MLNKRLVDQAIRKALSYLTATQESDGTFKSFSSPSLTPFIPTHTYTTTFTQAIILTALNSVRMPDAMTIRSRLANHLLTQKSENWSFNYWTRTSAEARAFPYPDDLDDTFAALSALKAQDATLIDGTTLARTVRLLLAAESQVGGPYFTWLTPRQATKWQDIDIAVNANIAYFLAMVAKPLPNLTAMMNETIEQGTFYSQYYPNKYPVIYFVARSYKGPMREKLRQHILLSQQDQKWETPLQTALMLSSLLHLGNSDQDTAIEYLLTAQKEDGSWDAEAFCLDPTRENQIFYNGAPALTTALVIEALQNYQYVQEETPLTKPFHTLERAEREIVLSIIKDYGHLDNDLKNTALDTLRHTLAGKNSQEITTLPHMFYSSLKKQQKLPNHSLRDLGAANTYGWIAYTIYDDFLDDEGNAKLLPVANISLRRCVELFERTFASLPTFQKVIREVFDTIDEANAWEMAHCRAPIHDDVIHIRALPRFTRLGRLADRSLGHALTPLGVLHASGIPAKSASSHALLQALRHYLIARQLNDDAHDWREDFKAGRLTYVGVLTLKKLNIKKGKYKVNVLMSKMERVFWYYTLPIICRRILYHVQASRRALHRSDILQKDNVLDSLLGSIEASVKETRDTLKETKRFLSAYTDNENKEN